MINFRKYFNPSYNYIGLLIIALLILLIIFINQDIKNSIKKIGTVSLVSGLITLLGGFFVNFLLDILISYKYKIFIQVISKNVFNHLLLASLIAIILGIIAIIFSKLANKPQPTNSKITNYKQ